MTAPSGREPARPQPGTDGAASTSSAAAQPRLSREAVVAFALLPVLLVAGFFLGSRLLGDSTDPGTTTAVGATASPETPGDDPVVGPPAASSEDPAVQGPAVPPVGESPAAAPSEEPAVMGPTAPAVTQEPTQAAEVSQEPTQAPEPTQEPTQAAEPTQEPMQQPTQAPEPTQEPAPEPTTEEPADQPATAGAAPAPQAGESVLMFRGFAGEDVRTWQARMVERGWMLQVDGIYGPETESVAERFQAEKGLAVDGLVGIQTWNAAWEAPIT